MKNNWFKRNYKNIIRISYIIPILVGAGISIFHVISWYDITNPITWAIYLSIGIEIAALSALAGMTAKMNKWVYLPFIIVTSIQLLGNIFASYSYIDITSEGFTAWVELFNPIFESFGWVKNGDLMTHKRILGILGGVFIPLISLSFLHLLISFNDKIEIGNEGVNERENEGENEEENEDFWVPQLNTIKKNEIPVKKKTSNGDYKEEIGELMVNDEDKKREPVIPTDKIKHDEISKIKDRGFSVKIPQTNNSIQKVDDNNNNMKKILYKRGNVK